MGPIRVLMLQNFAKPMLVALVDRKCKAKCSVNVGNPTVSSFNLLEKNSQVKNYSLFMILYRAREYLIAS